jgi:tetratricopeptide (TPR) repeat protein
MSRLLFATLAALTLAAPFQSPLAAQSSASLQSAVRLFDARDYSQAKAELAPVAAAEPGNAAAAYYLGRIAIVDGDVETAVSWLERATKLEPGNVTYQRWLGRAYAREVRRSGRFKQIRLAKKIRHAFETAVSLAPDDVDARHDLMQFYMLAPGFVGGGMGKAKAQAREIAARNPMLGTVAQGWIAEAEKDDPRAVREYEAALTQFPDSSDAYVSLGALYQRTKAWDKAFDVYERLVKARPDLAEGYYLIGRTASLAGTNLPRGEEALKAYLAKMPDEGDAPLSSAHYRLGVIYEIQGRVPEAEQQYESALRFDPGEPGARDALERLGKRAAK